MTIKDLNNTPLPEDLQRLYNELYQLDSDKFRHLLAKLMGNEADQITVVNNPTEQQTKLNLE